MLDKETAQRVVRHLRRAPRHRQAFDCRAIGLYALLASQEGAKVELLQEHLKISFDLPGQVPEVYYIGRKGALRTGRTLAESVPPYIHDGATHKKLVAKGLKLLKDLGVEV